MLWLVRAAVANPHTVVVGMMLVSVLGILSYQRTPTDILPNLKVPVVVIFCSYRGMPAPDMEQSVTKILERALTKADRLSFIESRSLLGIGIIKVYFRPEVDADIAASQVIALVNSEMQNLPPGMLPPSILKYDAAAVPVGNLVISSRSRDDKFLLDLTRTRIREELAGIEGLATAPSFGGVFRQVQVYVHPRSLEAMKMSPMDVARIVNSQSQVIPTGEMRIGNQNYYVSSNAMVQNIEDFKKIPVYSDGRKVVYLGDVAEVVDGTRWRTNIVRVDGRRAVYLPMLRQAGSSAVTVVDNIKDFLPKLYERGVVPEDVEVELAFDQSQYVRDALHHVQSEAVLGAILASLVVLLFLGSLQSTWIVALSIPLSILVALIGLFSFGHTLNIMTLGGLALVLGRVIDDTIVDVENTSRHLAMGKPPRKAVMDSATEISMPVFMATLTTIIVFLPLTFLTGVAKYLFTPLAVSATLAMVASYVVSRSVSPLCCSRFLKPHGTKERFPKWLLLVGTIFLAVGVPMWLLGPNFFLPKEAASWLLTLWMWIHTMLVYLGVGGVAIWIVAGLFWIAPGFDVGFSKFAAGYESTLRFVLRRKVLVFVPTIALGVVAFLAMTQVGQELFPEVDSSEFTIHMRATGGPRVEETERQVGEVEKIVKDVVSEEDLDLVLSNVGLSSRWSAIYTPNNGPHAAFVRVQLRSGFAGRHVATSDYVAEIRERLRKKYPAHDFFFETGGMIRRILNKGSLAPIEIQLKGFDNVTRRKAAQEFEKEIRKIPGIVDTYMPQGMDLPQFRINVDRVKAARPKITQGDIVRNVITALMSSSQLAPNFWIEPSSGNPYSIGVQYTEKDVAGVETLKNIPLTKPGQTGKGRRVLRLADVATIERTQGPIEVYHHSASRVSQIFVSVKDDDLARVAVAIEKLAARMTEEKTLSGGVRVEVTGEVSAMRDSFRDMAFSLILACVLVYLVMAAQFKSWIDPFVAIIAAPLGLIGVALILWMTNTSLNIQSCMGILMLVGIAVCNSVLLVEFANRVLTGDTDALAGHGDHGHGADHAEGPLDPISAVALAARVRLKPILMTAIATVFGLLPLAIHLRPGDEMNLPLARAVIGGLLASTVLTLYVIPALYVMVKRNPHFEKEPPHAHETPHAYETPETVGPPASRNGAGQHSENILIGNTLPTVS